MVEIGRIIEQNPWWKFGEEFPAHDKTMQKFDRALLKIERKTISLKPDNIYTIHGPRQVGKTTELKKKILNLIQQGVHPEALCYLSCDTLISRRELQKALDFFVDKIAEHTTVYLFLDEINFIKDWVPEIKRLADSEKMNHLIILITGSPFGVKIHSHELIGRGVEGNRYFMWPLCFREFARQIGKVNTVFTLDDSLKKELSLLSSSLDEASITLDQPLDQIKLILKTHVNLIRSLRYLFDLYLKTGGFPAVINSYIQNINEKERINPGLYETFIDIVLKDSMKQGKNETIMQQVLTAVIKKLGSRYEFRSIAEETEGVTHPTVIDYLQVLEDNFIVSVLYSYDFDKKIKRNKGAKKIYFTDPFIFHSFRSWLYGKKPYELSQETILDEEMVSNLVEGTVENHFSRVKEIPVVEPADRYLWFFYDARKELDFVFRRDQALYLGIEVKYQPRISAKDIASHAGIREYILLSRDEFDLSENIVVVPVSVLLSLIQPSEKNL